MNLVLALAFAGAVAATSPTDNFAFDAGTLAGWEGDGFTIAPDAGRGPGLRFGVCSGDNGAADGKKGTLHRAFTVPAAGGYLRCRAAAVRAKNCVANENLDVAVFASGKRILTKMTRIKGDFKAIANVLGLENGRPREYVWDLTNYAGQALRIALVDQDKRKDCYLSCSGFEIVAADDFESREFSRFMTKLVKDQRLSPVERYESQHFIALSNADEGYSLLRLADCELIYPLFFDHFRKRGFALREPLSKLMVAIFETHAGFFTYLGERLPDGVMGLYYPPTNTLVVYDAGTNRELVHLKNLVKERVRVVVGNDLTRRRYLEAFNRDMSDLRNDINISTVMHEVGHQLTFNCGMLNREGDTPFWLVEGLGCYCEPTVKGSWQGIGEANNPERLQMLERQLSNRAGFIPLQRLIEKDEYLRHPQFALLGYAQSWALVKMLIDERPDQFKNYLKIIYPRRISGARMDDFIAAFGSDLKRLDLRYQEYMRELVEAHPQTKKR